MGRGLGDSFAPPKDAVVITFPRSDGDASKRPEVPPRPTDGSVNYYRPVPIGDTSSIRWRVEVANRMVEHVPSLDPTKKYILADWPTGYAFFDHNKGFEPNQRHDLYLYGSKTVGKFRSVNEFVPHAIWLYRDGPDVPCGCKYCSKIKSQREVSDMFGLPSHLGPIESTLPVQVRRVPRPVDVPKPNARCNPERDRDLRASARCSRRFRIGEVVWCQIEPPFISPDNSDLVIDFWPSIVRETRTHITIPGGRSDSNTRDFGAQQSTRYKLQLLGVLHCCVMPESMLLPYLGYISPEHLLLHAQQQPPPPYVVSPNLYELSDFYPLAESTFVQDPPIPNAPQDHQSPKFVSATFDRALVNWALAIQVAAQIAGDWTFSDEYDIKLRFTEKAAPPPSNASSSQAPPPPRQSALDPKPVTEQRYQGIWWGGERIWESELVRLQTNRSSVNIAELLPASPGADDRTVFALVNGMFIEATHDNKAKGKICGPLLELAEETFVELNPVEESAQVHVPTVLSGPAGTPASGLGSGALPIPGMRYAVPPAPAGFKWRCITPPGYEASIDIGLVSGRYYAELCVVPPMSTRLVKLGLLDLNTAPPLSPANAAYAKKLDDLGLLVSLSGLAPSFYSPMGCAIYRKGRLESFKECDRAARAALWELWFPPAMQGLSQTEDVEMDMSANKQVQAAPPDHDAMVLG